MRLIRFWHVVAMLELIYMFHGSHGWIGLHGNCQRLQKTKLDAVATPKNSTDSSNIMTAFMPPIKILEDCSNSVDCVLKNTVERTIELDSQLVRRLEESYGVDFLYGECINDPNESEQFAIRKINAIMDICNSTMTADGEIISEQIVSKTLEELIHRVFRNQQQQLNLEVVDGSLLEQIEALFWRLDDLNVVPTYSSMETLWKMQKRHSQHTHINEKSAKQVGRSIRLLMYWCMWAKDDVNPNSLAPPPYEYIRHTFTLAKVTNVTMSFRMWDLYNELSDAHNARDVDLPREFYELVMDILAKSFGAWRLRQCNVLHDLERRYKATSNAIFDPTVVELESALMIASKYGNASEATWLFQALRDRVSKTESHGYLKYWFQALCKSKEQGWASYLDRLLMHSKVNDEKFVDNDLHEVMQHRYYYNMVLQKWATARTPSSGMRAEALFDRMVANYLETGAPSLRPNEESVHHVVMAYVREESGTLQKLLDAHRFLHRSLRELASVRCTTRRWRTFDNLLEAYVKHSEESMAMVETDRLFRFFLVQHRDGNISEEPDPYHLSHVLRIWNKAKTPEGAHKSFDFFKLMDSLYKQGKIKNEPDAHNIRQLLGTLAHSGESGYGEFAEKLLERILKTPKKALPDSFDSYVLGHIFWCVVKCNCNEKDVVGLHRAGKVLKRLEELHAENPAAVRLTGAAHKSVINGWASLGNADAGKQAQAILGNLESLHLNGSKHIRLTWDLYADVMKAWAKSSTSESMSTVEMIYNRWNDFEQAESENFETHPGIDLALAVAHASCTKGSLSRAEQILMALNKRFDAGDDGARVHSSAWNALLDAISKKSSSEDCLPKSLGLFEKMQQRDRLGKQIAELNSLSYESLMRSWLRSGHNDAILEMESLYFSTRDQFEDGNRSLQPSISMVDLLLEKYNEIENPEEDIAENAVILVQDAAIQFREGCDAMKPSRSTVWLVLALLGRSGNASKHRDAIDDIIFYGKR